jgi:hypothetical protein
MPEMHEHKVRDFLTERVSDLAGRQVSPEVAQAWARIAILLVGLSAAIIFIRLGIHGL